MSNLEAGMQSIMPVYFQRVGDEGDKEDQNKQIAMNENALNQNLTSLFNELDAIKTFLSQF